MLEIEFVNAGVEISLVLLLLLGLMVGVLSGFFGVGGGFLITGGLLVFGVPAPFAVGTGLTLIMGSSIINTLKHRHLGNVDFKLGLILVSGHHAGPVSGGMADQYSGVGRPRRAGD